MSSSERSFPASYRKWIVAGSIILSLIFLVFSVSAINSGGSWLLLLPPALILAFLAVLNIEKFLLLVVFLVPLSVQLIFIVPESPADISLPTEIMLALILLLLIFKVMTGREISGKLLFHPVSIISYCMMVWSLITSVTGTIPVVSLKSLLTKLWFFAGFYLLAAELFRKSSNIRRYFIAYLAGMIPVVVYYLIRMWQAGIFNQKAAYKSIRPFFNDHTSFGAALAFCIPLIIYFILRRETHRLIRAGMVVLLPLFSAGFLFSYSRAAWLSLAVAAMVTSLLLLKIPWRFVLPASVAVVVGLIMSWQAIVIRLQENRQESADDIKGHLQSISNIRSDASNMERINRWKAALKMFSERPLLGWGPATYQFNYAGYQMAEDKTIISTNWGEGGNAHSEYLGPLVDSGVAGLLFYLALLVFTVHRGIRIFRTHAETQVRLLALALVAGLITYVVHGALNNFLDTDKISALFWGMTAAIVSIDISSREEKQPQKEREGNELPEVGGDN